MKKIISILTIISIILTFIPVFAQETDSEEAVDTTVIEKLYRFGIINEDLYKNYDPDGYITRAEFADIAASTMGLAKETTADVTKVFSDVTADTEYAASIYQVYAAGLMIGDDVASFYPENNITYDEAVKTAVVMLGLYDIAYNNGGYVEGFRTSAANRGLLKGVSGSPDSPLSQESVYNLIDNLIDAPLFVVKSFVGGEAQMGYDENVTIMSDILNLESCTGIVTAYESTSLKDDTEDIGVNSIRIEDTVFELTYTSGDVFVGYNVKAYYNANDEIIYIEPYKTNVLTISRDELEKETTLEEIAYRIDGGRIKYADVASKATYIYNGKKLTAPLVEEIIPEEGFINLIDNNNDGKYEVVIVEDYMVCVVDGVVVTDEKIKLKYGMGTLNVAEEDNVKARFFLDGKEAQLSDIARWNVLSVKQSKNETGTILCDIYISSLSIEGKVTQSYYDGDDMFIEIEDQEQPYCLSRSFINRVEAGAEESSYPTLDKHMIYYLDTFGKIAAINTVSSAKNYGYVLRCYYDFEQEKAFIKMYTKDDEFVTYPLSEKFKVNGEKGEHEFLENALEANTEDGTVHQLIVYKINADNEVTEIQMAVDKTSEPYYVTKDDEFVLNAHPGINATNGRYKGMRFYKYLAEDYPFYFLEGTTINFQIPSDLERENDFAIVTKLSGTDVSLAGPLYVYDAGNGGQIGAIVSSPRASTDFADPKIVSKVVQTLNDDGEVCSQLVFFDGSSIYANEADVSYEIPEKNSVDNASLNWGSLIDYSDVKISDLERGDVIEYTEENGFIDSLRILVRRSNIGPSRVNDHHLAENGTMLCTAYSVSDNQRSVIVKYTDGNGAEKYQSMFINGTAYMIDTDTGETSYSAVAEIEKGDTLLINTFWWSAKMVIIYR